MRLPLAGRRLAARLAIFAVLLAALAPAITHALGSARAAAWTVVCTQEGPRRLALPDGAPPVPATHGAGACPFCATHAACFALPPPDAVAARFTPAAAPLPPPFLHAPLPLHGWMSARPRAPPSLS